MAVVVAETRYQAADALEGIDVDYSPLPPVLDMEAALAEGADLVHSDKGTNRDTGLMPYGTSRELATP